MAFVHVKTASRLRSHARTHAAEHVDMSAADTIDVSPHMETRQEHLTSWLKVVWLISYHNMLQLITTLGDGDLQVDCCVMSCQLNACKDVTYIAIGMMSNASSAGLSPVKKASLQVRMPKKTSLATACPFNST